MPSTVLKRSYCNAAGSVKMNGNIKYNGKVLKCPVYHKQISGNVLIRSFDEHIGAAWKEKAAGDRMRPPRGQPWCQNSIQSDIKNEQTTTSLKADGEKHTNEMGRQGAGTEEDTDMTAVMIKKGAV